jgi:hypothetical protein
MIAQAENKSRPSSPGRLRRAMARLAAAVKRLFDHDHYQPEKHYMRGPGPKWQAKRKEAARREETSSDTTP